MKTFALQTMRPGRRKEVAKHVEATVAEGFVLWTSLGSPPEVVPNLSSASLTSALLLAGVVDDVDFCLSGRPSSVKPQPDKT